MSQDPAPSPARALAEEFVEAYGRTWKAWDLSGFVDLFSDDVTYVAHAMQETVVGRPALAVYIEKEAGEQGEVNVRMGRPVIEGDRVAAEFWVTATSRDWAATFAGCFIAQLASDGRCANFREYWFDEAGHTDPFGGWGE
jgi:ketosteroid isomerase-like protein